MPIANVSTVYSFSSEDPSWPATNLLSKTSKKWRCKSAGEKKAFVCFQLDKPATITGVDIGNEHSAYVTVQVARKGAKDDDFQEILLATSFMSSSESRNSTNINRVRCFHKEALIESVASSKWELVKVICTQPYNNQKQFGLSFVKLHILAEPDTNKVAKPLVPAGFLNNTSSASTSNAASPLSMFKMRADSTDSESDTSASLFQRWKQNKTKDTTVGSSTAASIRDASASPFRGLDNKTKFTPKHPSSLSSSSAAKPNPSSSNDDNQGSDEKEEEEEEKPKRVDRNRKAIVYDSDDEKPNEKLERKLQHDLAAREKAAKAREVNGKDNKNNSSRTTERTSQKFKDFLDVDEEDSPTTTTSIKPSPLSSTKPTTTPAEKRKDNNDASTPVAKPKTVDRFSPIATTTPAAVAPRKRTLSPVASSSKASPSKRSKHVAAPSKQIRYKPFGKLLEGVVLVISGIQNPVRANIRDKALKLGAKYKPDWDSSCTHLICAFKNTPKYNQVKGSGKIIKKDWIGACYDLRKRIPWRRYALDGAEKVHPESEDEIEDISRKLTDSSPPSTQTSEVNESVNLVDDDETDDSGDDDDRYNEKSDYTRKPSKNSILSSGSDTEDEIERAVKRKTQTQKSPAKKQPPPSPPSQTDTPDNDDVFDQTTDDEAAAAAPQPQKSPAKKQPPPSPPSQTDTPDNDDVFDQTTDDAAAAAPQPQPQSKSSTTKRRSPSPLPEFYKDKIFYISSNVNSVETIKLTRFIGVYGGKLTTNAAEANFVLSNKAKQLPAEYDGEVVKPLWVFECNDLECLLPTKRYRFDVNV